MKTNLFLYTLVTSLVCVSGCTNEADDSLTEIVESRPEAPTAIPDGYFEVQFFSDPETASRAAVTGQDARIQYLHYLIYKSTGEFVKEKTVWTPANGTPSWPMATVRDTLPNGSYNVVFLGNVEKTLFPFASGSYADVLTNYKSLYSDARIVLPNTEFPDNTEYYWAKAGFSDQSPNTTILLQRIIGAARLHRNFIDAQQALNTLVNNIVTQIGYKNILRTTVSGLLPGALRDALGPLGTLVFAVLGGLDNVINLVTAALVEPIVDVLYAQVLQGLTNQIGMALTGNTDQAGLLQNLGVLLNPWALGEARTAIVSINDFPRSVDLDLNVKETFPGIVKFRYDFNSTSVYDEKAINIKGFAGTWDVREIDVIKSGLITGLVVDQVLDDWVLNAPFIDITDPVSLNIPVNRRFKDDYSFLDLKLKSYTQQTDGNHGLGLQIKLGNIANIDNILGNIPILSTILNLVLSPIKNITINTSVNLPLLGVDNLQLSGSWDTPTAY